MKIGVLTRRFGHNLGSSLQAFAMSEMLKQLGHEVEIIDYDESAAHIIWKIRPIIEHFQFKYPLPLWKGKRHYLSVRLNQEKRFADFEFRYLPLSLNKCCSPKSLWNQAKDYKKIVVGSDQIWSPFLYDPNFYGAFVPKVEKHRLVAYAPSIGTSNPNEITPEQIKYINEIPNISCREEVGAKLISNLIQREVPVVLDPTLMVEKSTWYKIADSHKIDGLPERYLLTYFLGTDTHKEALELLATKTKSKIVNIAMFNKPNSLSIQCYKTITDLGPAEFLYLVKNATYVATDSFHATIFSWIFNTDFTVFERFKEGDRQNQNSRIYSLLSILGCEGHLHNSPNNDTLGFFEQLKYKSLRFLIDNI